MAKYLRMWLLFAALAACLAFSACGGGKKEKDRKRDSEEKSREETVERENSGEREDASEKEKEGILGALLGKDADSESGPDEDAGDPALRAYAQVVREKEAEYGEGSLKNTGISWIDGVGFLHLTDFDGDGTEELILAHGSQFDQTLEVYAAEGDKARQIYSGGALMYGMDTPLVELWDGPGGKKYLLVNKGDYFDGKVSFLGYDGQEMTETAESSLADPGADTPYTRAERFALNFDGGEEGKTRALGMEAESRLADVRAKLGISGTSGGLPAAGGAKEHDSIFDGQGDVVIDDDELTLRVHGKTVVRFKDMDRAAYCITVENHTPYLLELSGAHLRDDFVYEPGTVDGATIIGIHFAEKTEPEPEKYDITEAMTFPGIPAGETMQLYMAPECAGYGIKTPEHLVNVTANIHTSHGSGDTFEYRNYVLSLDQGGTAPALPDGYEDYQCRYFSFTVPKAWEYTVIGETDDVGQYNISLPPKYNDHAMSSIIIRYDDFFSAAESVKSIEEFYLTDNRDGNYTVNTFEREIDGKQLPAVEVFGKISDSRFRFYFLDMPDGKTVTIQTSVELPFLEELDGEYEKFLDSIRW